MREREGWCEWDGVREVEGWCREGEGGREEMGREKEDQRLKMEGGKRGKESRGGLLRPPVEGEGTLVCCW